MTRILNGDLKALPIQMPRDCEALWHNDYMYSNTNDTSCLLAEAKFANHLRVLAVIIITPV